MLTRPGMLPSFSFRFRLHYKSARAGGISRTLRANRLYEIRNNWIMKSETHITQSAEILFEQVLYPDIILYTLWSPAMRVIQATKLPSWWIISWIYLNLSSSFCPYTFGISIINKIRYIINTKYIWIVTPFTLFVASHSSFRWLLRNFHYSSIPHRCPVWDQL